MKIRKFIAPALLASVLLIGSCKKDEDKNKDLGESPMGEVSPTIPSGAAGALYFIKNVTVYKDPLDNEYTSEDGSALAWFNNYTNSDDAGVVLLNTDTLSKQPEGFPIAMPWYINEDNTPTNTAAWKIAGSSKVTAFNHTDNTAFPEASFTAPVSVSISGNLTVNYTVTGANDGVICSIWGESEETVAKKMAAGSGSVTFTAAELSKCSFGQDDELMIQVMPYAMTSAQYNSKTYYFLKQGALSKSTPSKP